MSLDSRAVYSVAPSEPQPVDMRLRASWGERLVTAVATTIAVLIVALIAVLMGMA